MDVWSLADTLAALDYTGLVDHLERAHREPAAGVADSYVETPAGNGLLARTAMADGVVSGVKLATIHPANRDRPSVQAVFVLFDGATGSPTAIFDATALTWFKTACDSALGARFLCRGDAESMLMLGAGAMAPHLIAAHRAVRPSLRRVAIWNRTPARAEMLAGRLRNDGVEATAVADLDAALSVADLVCAATMTSGPLVRGERLRPGAHVDLVGAYLPDTREADDAAMRRGRLFVDSRETTRTIGELAIPIASCAIDADAVVGDLYELCRGTVAGRQGDDEVTVFKNGGGGHLDLMTAQYVAARLRH